MGDLILLPFKATPKATGGGIDITVLKPVAVQEGVTTLEDVRAWYATYLGRPPRDDAEAQGYGRVGLPRAQVELEIATSQEAINYATARGFTTTPSGQVIRLPGVSAWGQHAGDLIATYMAAFSGLERAPGGMAAVLAVQADLEDSRGTSFGAQTNNPLNLRPRAGGPWPGEIGVSPGGFAEFDTLEDGALSCARNYTIDDSARFYAAVWDAFKSGDPLRFAQAIDDSPWNAGGYGGRIVAGARRALGMSG